MTWMIVRRAAACVLTLLAVGCGALDVSDPTAIGDKDLANATGADLLRRDALQKWYFAVGDGAVADGLLADEFLADPPAYYQQYGIVSPDEVLDRRQSLRYEQLVATSGGGIYGGWQGVRRAATVALPRLRAYAPGSVPLAYLGELFAVRGLATLRLAEDVCAGFPLHDVVDLKPVYGPPLTTDQVFEHALADLDSALVDAADSARILQLARIGRARALLGLGRFAEAASAAAAVPTTYVWQAEYSTTGGVYQPNPLLFGLYQGDLSRSVADREGGTGLDFVAAGDPRVETTLLGTAQDGVTGIYAMAKYPDQNAPIVLASGVEARLIEAEAALAVGDGAWLTILNALRATQITPALPALADPGSADARVDLLFRERAFWLFGTGHRLGDLRRLISRYGRPSESVFPTGAYRRGGVYETATSIPFPAALETPYSPAVTGCTAR